MATMEKRRLRAKNLPPSQRRGQIEGLTEKDPLSVRIARRVCIQILVCLLIIGSSITAFQMKTDWAKKAQELVYHTVKDQIDMGKVQQTGHRIAGYFHEKLYEKK